MVSPRFLPSSSRRLLFPFIWMLTASTIWGCSGSPEADPGNRTDTAVAENTTAPDEPAVRITSPKSGATLTGLANVELDVEIPIEGAVDAFFGVDDETLGELRQLENTLQVKTQNFENGEHELIARLIDEDGEIYEDRVQVVIDNPTQRLLSYELSDADFQNGDEIVLALEFSESDLEVDVDFEALDSGYDPDQVTVESGEDGDVIVSYSLSASNTRDDGQHEVMLTATGEDDESIRLWIPIRLRNTPRLPVSIAGATFVDEPVPALLEIDDDELPTVDEIQGDGALLNGGSARLAVEYTDSESRPAEKLIVFAEDYSGYYVVPLTEDDAGEVSLDVSQIVLEPEFFETLPEIDLNFGIIDGIGELVRFATHTLALLDVGDSTVGATLLWDSPADLDIGIITPNDELLDFETPELGTGKLNLDSNALCEDGVRVENIAWPLGEAPIGTFQVVVNMYDNCGFEEVTNWTIKTNACGVAQIISGTLDPSAVDMSGTGSVEARFEVDCTHVLRGKVSYEKLGTIRPAGSSAASTPAPVAFAPVRVHNADNEAEIKKAVTDANGNYTLSFFNPTDTNYYVEAEAIWDDPTFGGIARRVRVTPDTDDTPYTSRTASLDGARNPNALNVDLHISEANNAGAFNIRDIVMKGFSWVNARAPSSEARSLGPLRARWGRGQAMQITDSHGNVHQLSYQSGTSLFLNGTLDDQDEWDDTVIMHEFMHYVIRNLVYSPLPGGPHSGKSKPDLAWSEGLATGLGQVALGTPEYVSENRSRAFSYNIETGMSRSVTDSTTVLSGKTETPLNNLRGASPNAVTGNIHEALVSMLIWDLNDGIDTARESHDRFDTNRAQFALNIVFNPPSSGSYIDRHGNGVDLADFLDHYIAGSATRFNQELFCLTDDLGYPYDQYGASLTSCPAIPPGGLAPTP